MVFPTPVGVFPKDWQAVRARESLPHARGGVSVTGIAMAIVGVSSPRPWGCFYLGQVLQTIDSVFPTPVGVFLFISAPLLPWLCLPHARGGVSTCYCGISCGRGSSPRPWGCFFIRPFKGNGFVVFPTPVGVFPKAEVSINITRSLPHARGGVSLRSRFPQHRFRSSPRPWGCFLEEVEVYCLPNVFPTPVGVFLRSVVGYSVMTGLPHARGGVSVFDALTSHAHKSSPRPWGCFLELAQMRGGCEVFPTPVGVFLKGRCVVIV